MNQDSRTPDDEQLYVLVRQYDEAVAHGANRSSVDESASSLKHPEAAEFERLCQCVTLLEQVRRGRDSPPARTAMLFNGHGVSLQVGEGQRRIGRFELRGEIGRGGCGIVFRAYDATLDRDVAVKIPRPEALVSDELRERFLREARAAGNLDHPNVVPIYDVGEDGAVCYIAAAYVEGPSLATWLGQRQETIDARQAAELVAALADAVEQAHDRGVIHRDIKPGNILLQPHKPGRSRRACRSIRRGSRTSAWPSSRESTDSATRTGMVIGTPAYMAPEQAEGRLNEIDPATDVYALGAILYELLAGQPPLRGESDADTLRRIVTEDPPLVRFARARHSSRHRGDRLEVFGEAAHPSLYKRGGVGGRFATFPGRPDDPCPADRADAAAGALVAAAAGDRGAAAGLRCFTDGAGRRIIGVQRAAGRGLEHGHRRTQPRGT